MQQIMGMKLDLIKIDKEIVSIINDSAKGLVRNCARSAIFHLEKSWEIKDIDPEMAVFRAITAEEEAATSIFIALKEKGYDNSQKIKFKNHTYKQAVAPFFDAIGKFISESAKLPNFPFGKNLSLSIDSKDGPKKLKLSVELKNGLDAFPIPPLHFSIQINGSPYTFNKELTEITTGKNRKEIVNYIKELANLRNCLIYANTNGVPKINGEIDGHLQKRQKTVFSFLRVLCLIFPHKERADFVQQSLNAFLLMLGDIEEIIESNNAQQCNSASLGARS